MELPLDRYSLQARLFPMLITLTPLALALASWLPGQWPAWNSLGVIIIWLGVAALLAQVGRDQGKRKEAALFKMWGGIPTTRMLSHRNSSIDRLTLRRYHERLKILLPELTIPGANEEVQNPAAGDRVYESCIRYLREKTRDRQRFPLVFAENVNYGFRRNLWALKSFGIVIAAFGIVACGLFLVLKWTVSSSALLVPIAGMLISIALLILWVSFFNESWVRLAAEAYAERLLGTLDNL